MHSPPTTSIRYDGTRITVKSYSDDDLSVRLNASSEKVIGHKVKKIDRQSHPLRIHTYTRAERTKSLRRAQQMTKPRLMNAFTKNVVDVRCAFHFFFSSCAPLQSKFHRNSSHFMWIFLCSRVCPANAWCIIMRNYANWSNTTNERESTESPFRSHSRSEFVLMLMKESCFASKPFVLDGEKCRTQNVHQINDKDTAKSWKSQQRMPTDDDDDRWCEGCTRYTHTKKNWW